MAMNQLFLRASAAAAVAAFLAASRLTEAPMGMRYALAGAGGFCSGGAASRARENGHSTLRLEGSSMGRLLVPRGAACGGKPQLSKPPPHLYSPCLRRPTGRLRDA